MTDQNYNILENFRATLAGSLDPRWEEKMTGALNEARRKERERCADALQQWADDDSPAFPYRNPADVVSDCARFVRELRDAEEEV